MKSIEIFCASPASTAICSSMDQRAIIRPGSKSMDRHSHRSSSSSAPCSSHLPLDPSKPFSNHRKATTCITDDTSDDNNDSNSNNKQLSETLLSKKSSARVEDHGSSSPRSSSRFLLSDKPYMDFIFDSKRVLQVSSQPVKDIAYSNSDDYRHMILKSFSNKSYENPLCKTSDVKGRDANDDGDDASRAPHKKPSVSLSDHLNVQKHPSPPAAPSSNHQVVELTVSIHCKGCEHKLRKHISRMEGVTSFSIDLEIKKLTVIGNVTPSGVLASISKVMKYAQLL